MTGRLLLIGGTSHAGKSTIAAKAAAHFGWRCISTDSLARHPGRPWRDPPEQAPPHVVEHYRDLGLAALMQSVLHHYRSMWVPYVLPLIDSGEPLVVEGSALLPELVASVLSRDSQAVWLVADDDVLRQRIGEESRRASRNSDERVLIDAFAGRAIAFNRFIAGEVERFGLRTIEVGSGSQRDGILAQIWQDDDQR